MRAASPILTFPPGLRLSSPPHTPTAPSTPPFFEPKLSAVPGSGPGGFSPPFHPASVAPPPNILPFHNGHINYSHVLQRISPCSSNSSEAGVSEPEPVLSEDDSQPGSPALSAVEHASPNGRSASHPPVSVGANFTIEELSDFDEDDMAGRTDVLHPFIIEYAESDRPIDTLEHHVLCNFENLQFCSPGPETSSDESDLDEDAHEAMLQRIRDRNRRLRMSQSSVGTKRTVSERGSESDHDDVRNCVGFEEVGSSARRLKRKMGGDRRSLILQDPPPRIDEVVEPEELEETLARELPFYEYTSMEVDSPRSPSD